MLLVVEELGALPQVNEQRAMPGWPTIAALYAVIGVVCGVAHWWPTVRVLLRAVGHAIRAPRAATEQVAPWLPLAGGVLCGATLAGWVLLLGG